MRAKDVVGDYGERLAVRYLQAQGLTVLGRGWRCPLGEIDIIAADGSCLVICEVKTRRSLVSGRPEEAVTAAKLARLRRLTGQWLQGQAASWRQVRIDVIAVQIPRRGAARIEHLRAVG